MMMTDDNDDELEMSASRKGGGGGRRQQQYHVVNGNSLTTNDANGGSSTCNANLADESPAISPEEEEGEHDSMSLEIDSSSQHQHNIISSSSSSNSNNRRRRVIVARLGGGAQQLESSPTCFRVMVGLVVALSLDIMILTVYIYQRDPSPVDVAASSSSSTTLNSNNNHTLGTLEWKALPPVDSTLTKLAFGSCMSQRMPQPHWDVVMKYNPDLLLLMGDNVYGDCDEETCQILRQAYLDFEQHASVRGAAPLTPVFATLDDHDYGQGDCSMDNPYKHLAVNLFQQVFQVPPSELPAQTSSTSSNSNNDNQGGGGVYRSKTWGPPGRRVQVILLDTRFGRSPFYITQHEGGTTAYAPPPDDYNQQMLSESQWAWLQEKLLVQPADLRLIVSSIQVLNDVTGYECWRHLPAERQRFYDLLQKTQQTMARNSTTTKSPPDGSNSTFSFAPILLLSGDRHVGGFYATADDGIHEVTASSFTHSYPADLHSDTCDATPELCEENDPRRLGDLQHENNFGTLDIDWEQRTYTVNLVRADTTPYISYYQPDLYGPKGSDAGSALASRRYRF